MSFHHNLLQAARENHFAVPAFNYLDVWGILAVIEAADELQAPVYIASAPLAVNSLGLDFCAAMGNVAQSRSNEMVFNHLDHCIDPDICCKAVDLGYRSVMIDCSSLSLEENISKTRKVVEYAHPKQVFVEAELGQIFGSGDEANAANPVGEIATPDTCAELAEKTHIDSLAIGIGNQHGYYHATPHLNLDLLEKASSMVDIPLVLHGSTGLSDNDVRACIARGVCKVNVGTAIHNAYKCAVRDCINDHPEISAITSFTIPAKLSMKEEIKRWIRLVGADGKRSLFQ